MAVWQYKKPGWFLDIPIVRETRGYTPNQFKSQPVHKPSGNYNPGGYSPLQPIIGMIVSELMGTKRHGQYVQGGYKPSMNTHRDHVSRRNAAAGGSGLTREGGYQARTVEKPRDGNYFPGAGYSAPTHVDTDPYGNYYFELSIVVDNQPKPVAHFMECSGLKTACTVFEFEEGGLNARSHKLPGQSKWENVVLRYATSASLFMASWRDRWLQGEFNLRKKYNGVITLRNNKGDQIQSYAFTNAWPVSWEGPSLNAGGSELAIETLELAHDGLTIDTTVQAASS